MLTGGFYAEVDLAYDPSIAEETAGRPSGIESLREIQLSKSGRTGHSCTEGDRSSHSRNGRISLFPQRGLNRSILNERT